MPLAPPTQSYRQRDPHSNPWVSRSPGCPGRRDCRTRCVAAMVYYAGPYRVHPFSMDASRLSVAAFLSLAVSATVAYAISQRRRHRGCVAAAWVLLFFFEIIVLSWPGGWHSCEYQLFMVVVLSYICCCWNGNAGNPSSENRDVEMDQMDTAESTAGWTDAPKPDCGTDEAAVGSRAAAPTGAPSTKRLPYLDNLRAFLMAIVVVSNVGTTLDWTGQELFLRRGSYISRHVASTFLGAKESALVAPFKFMVGIMIFLINLCVAALFFFVSAYFVPASYTRAGGWPGFQAAKRWRLLIPALFFYGVVYPTSRLVGGYKSYHPFTGHTWFSWWLLLFNLAYASFPAKEITTEELAEPLADRRAPNAATTADPPAFFSTRFRTIAGLICSVSMVPWFLSSYYIANWYTGFALMPTPFLVTVYILMYYLGVQAANGRSLERPLTQQLDISPLSLVCHVVIQGIAVLVAMGMAVQAISTLATSKDADAQAESIKHYAGMMLIFMFAAGVYCLNMSLLMLVAFQRWANVETRWTHFLARGAYGVYLLHPFVVTVVARFYLFLSGNNLHSMFGFVFIAVLSLAITWPVAYSLAQLPVLKTIL